MRCPASSEATVTSLTWVWDGLALAFLNRTGRHLWESVERLRDVLAIGRDYFQLHVAALVLQDTGRLLVVQQNGRWTLPGTYVVVGESWREALGRMLESRFSLQAGPQDMTLLELETESPESIPEAAVAKAFAVMRVDAGSFQFEPGERYRASRWLQNPRMIDELTFTDSLTRTQAYAAFRWLSHGPSSSKPSKGPSILAARLPSALAGPVNGDAISPPGSRRSSRA